MDLYIHSTLEEINKQNTVSVNQRGELGLINNDGKNLRFTRLNSTAGKKIIKKIAKKYDKILTNKEIDEIIGQLELDADENPTVETSMRVYRTETCVEIDLADSNGAVAKIIDGNIEIITNGAEGLFEKTPLMKALPSPDLDGDYTLIKPYLNISHLNQMLVIAWLTYTLAHPKSPSTNFVLLFLIGDQGSGKSFMTRLLISLVDPSVIGTQIFPRKQSDLIAFAGQRHCIAFDNMRELTNLWSDLLCVACTGGAASHRKLYTDGDIHESYIHIAMIINGIHNPINQSDLAQRTLPIEVSLIEGENRITERELLDQFNADKSKIFGGLLNLIAKILQHLPSSEVIYPERMIEFSHWLSAMESATEMAPGELQKAFSDAIKNAQRDTLQENAFAAAIIKFASTLSAQWTGTPSELLGKLEFSASSHAIRSADWPKSAISLSKKINSLKASLISHDVEVTLSRGKERRITITNSEAY